MDDPGDDGVRSPFSYNTAIPDVKGPTNFICYWQIFVIANYTKYIILNIGNEKKCL